MLSCLYEALYKAGSVCQSTVKEETGHGTSSMNLRNTSFEYWSLSKRGVQRLGSRDEAVEALVIDSQNRDTIVLSLMRWVSRDRRGIWIGVHCLMQRETV